jgi:integrase
VIWKAAQGLAYPNGTFVQMLMLSGQRRREVSDMTWRELDLPHRVWTLPAERSKNGKAHLVPLSDAVIELLEMIPRAPGDTYVFSFGNGKPLNDFDRIKRQLDAVLPDLPHWTLHDLRRTMRTELGRLGIRPDIAERCICHLIGSTVSRTYDRHEYFQEKAAAMNRWAQELNAIVHGRLDAKVVSLR